MRRLTLIGKTTVICFGILVCVASLLYLFQDYYSDMWNGARLARAFLVTDPSFFPLVGRGPLLASGHGPISFLFFVPATFTPNPTAALTVALAINVSLYLIPIAIVSWLSVRQHLEQRRIYWIMLLMISSLLLTVDNTTLSYILSKPHVDIQAIFLATLSCLLLTYSEEQTKRSRLIKHLAASGLISLAVWSKQLEMTILVAQALYLALVHGWRIAVQYMVTVAIFLAVCSLVIAGYYGIEPIRFNMFEIFSSHPRHDSLYELFRLGQQALFQDEILVFATLLLIATAIDAKLATKKNISWLHLQDWARENTWLIFFFCAAVHFPIGVLANSKWGGHVNSLHFHYYGLLCVLWLIPWTQRAIPRTKAAATAWIYAAILLLSVKHSESLLHLTEEPRQSIHQAAFDLLVEEPGKYYFPWYPLAHVMADGKVYHFEHMLVDWKSAGVEPTRQQLRDYFPEQLEYIVYHKSDRHTYTRDLFSRCFPEEPVEKKGVGWLYYKRKGELTDC